MRHFNLSMAVVMTVIVAIAGSCRKIGSSDGRSYKSAPVVLISLDTLRADHLPLFGYGAGQTPHIDRLRADGVLFTNAYAQVPLTLPSHTSLLTGVLPALNGVHDNIGYRLDDPRRPAIPTALKSNGYATGAAISSYVLRSSTGLGALFDEYDDRIEEKPGEPLGALQRSGYATEEVARSWIERHRSEPFFYFLHIFEPHAPYEPPEPFRSRFANPYDGEIATADDIVGRFIGYLKSAGIYDQAVIVLFSDHGEGLFDHGEPEHGLFLYREDIHVPLIVKLPGRDRAGQTEDRPVALLDIFPTIAQLCAIDAPAGLSGQSLFSVSASPRNIFSETLYPRLHLGWSELRSLVGTDLHYIEAPKPELYAFKDDPGERKNILLDRRREYASLKKEMAAHSHDVAAPGAIDAEEAARLAALGYLGSTQRTPAGPLPDPKDRVHVLANMIEAMRLQREGRVGEAETRFADIVRENPGFVDAWNQLAVSYESEGRYEDAVATYRKAIQLSPQLADEFGLALGSALLRLERYDEAEAHAHLGEKLNPGGAHMLLARIAFARQNLTEAQKQAEMAINAGYARTPASVLLIQILAQQNKIDEAFARLAETSSEVEKNHTGPVESLEYARGDLLARAGRKEEATAAFRREIAQFPKNKLAYAGLAIVRVLDGNGAGAREVMEEMGRKNRNRRTFLFAAHTLEELHDSAGAAEWRRRADRLK